MMKQRVVNNASCKGGSVCGVNWKWRHAQQGPLDVLLWHSNRPLTCLLRGPKESRREGKKEGKREGRREIGGRKALRVSRRVKLGIREVITAIRDGIKYRTRKVRRTEISEGTRERIREGIG